jgi:histidyl-tRNA synthetase
MSKQKKLKPELASGFKDRRGNELILKDRLIEIIKRNFQLYGFEPLETPGFEISENIGKFIPDEGRPMSGVFGFKDQKDWISLRYDLTAPLARYVSENFDSLSKPFKRYQVGSVWRNEKPGPGRYREFTQIDADIVGTKNVLADADMCVLLADTLNKCGLNKNEYLIEVSNRKLIQGLLEELKITNDSKKLTIIRAADKLDRVNIAGVKALLGKGRKDKSGDFTKGAGLTENQSKEIINFLKINSFSKLGNLSSNSIFKEGISELNEIFELTKSSRFSDRIKFSPAVIRGIEYYTGAIFEANLLFKVKNKKGEEVEFGSVGGGGRYDNLITRFTQSIYPATGVSIGLDRLLYAIDQKEIEKVKDNNPIVICVFDKKQMPQYNKLLTLIRSSNINSEIYCGNGNLKTQMKYANKKKRSSCHIVR